MRVLDEFSPFLHLLQSYNTENYERQDWCRLSRRIISAIIVTIFILSMLNVVISAIWYLFENDATLDTVLISAPLLLTITGFFITIVVLIRKNRTINETIELIQKIVNQRESSL